ncbi:FAD-binding oxidoreductase, partial [Chloroflexota bacterium]
YKPEIGLPDVDAMLIINLEGSKATVKEEVAEVISACKQVDAVEVKKASTQEEMDSLWAGRRAVLSAAYRLDDNKAAPNVAGDYGVPIEHVAHMLKEVRRIAKESGIDIVSYSHVGDGNLHGAMVVNVLDEEELARAEKAGEEIYNTVLKLGGTIAPEHGVGASKVKWLKKEQASSYKFMLAIKKIFDPNNIMNPGKLFETP